MVVVVVVAGAHEAGGVTPTGSAEPGSGSARWALVAGGAAVVAAVVALYLNAREYWPFIADDAFISLRYAGRLLDGHGLTWTPGPPVEGYSNLLWILLCGALGAFGLDLLVAARVLGGLGMGAVFVAVLWGVRPRRALEVAAVLVAMVGFAVAGPTGAWTIGGLEPPLVAGLLAWALALCAPQVERGPVTRRQILVPGVVLALLALTRVDGAVLVAAVCIGVVLHHGLRWGGWRRGLLLAIVPASAFLAQVLFRLVYYDAIIPNTARVKVAFTIDRLESGWDYVVAAASSSALMLVVAAVPVVVGARRRTPRWRLAVLAWIVAGVWAAYLVFIGGDIFPAYRHFIPVLASVTVAAAAGLADLGDRWPREGWGAVTVAAALVTIFAVRQPSDPENQRAVTERWEYNAEVIGRLLHRAFGDREPLLAAGAVGSLCYYADTPCLDMLGLNDRHIARHRPEDFGTGFIGHELGDGAYALRREPDLVIFCGPTGRATPCSRGEKQMVADPSFHRLYELVYFRGTTPSQRIGRVWVRRDGVVGIGRELGAVTIPAYLLREHGRSRAELDEHDRIGLRLPALGSGHIDVALSAGTWRLRVAANPPGAVRTRVQAEGEVLADGGAELSFWVDRDGQDVRLELQTSTPAHVRELVLARVDG